MMTNLQQVKELLPLYYIGDSLLVGLKSDFTDLIKDALVVEVSLKGGSIKNGPCSLQKKLKFGPYFPIEKHENKQFQKVISECLNANVINEIIDLLLNPEQEAILSMVWLPERLKISEDTRNN